MNFQSVIRSYSLNWRLAAMILRSKRMARLESWGSSKKHFLASRKHLRVPLISRGPQNRVEEQSDRKAESSKTVLADPLFSLMTKLISNLQRQKTSNLESVSSRTAQPQLLIGRIEVKPFMLIPAKMKKVRWKEASLPTYLDFRQRNSVERILHLCATHSKYQI